MKRYLAGLCALLLLLMLPMTAMGEDGKRHWDGHEDDWATGATPVPAPPTLPPEATPIDTVPHESATKDAVTTNIDTAAEEDTAEDTSEPAEGFEPSQDDLERIEGESSLSVDESGGDDDALSPSSEPTDGAEAGSEPVSNPEQSDDPVSSTEPIPSSGLDATAGTGEIGTSGTQAVPQPEAIGMPTWLAALLALLLLVNCVALGVSFLRLKRAIRGKQRKNDHIGIGRGQ